MTQKFDWSKAEKPMVENVLRQGEIYLQAMLAAASSADQRSAVLAGIFITAATALIAALIAALLAGSRIGVPIYVGGIFASVMFLIGAALCIWATIPVSFWLPGNQPKEWFSDVASNRPLVECLGEEAENYQSKIDENRKVLVKNGKRIKWGAICGVVAPVFGSVFYLVASCLIN